MSAEKRKILSGAAILGAGTFFAKLLGAVYRVPLTGILGGAGIGLYQLVFPVYTVLLDFSGAGAPSALSKIIAAGDGADKEKRAFEYLRNSLALFSALGLVFSFLMFIFSRPLAAAQGNIDAAKAYMFLSPSVFLVCILSSFRGYFQGLMNMKPTAVSQIVEQAIKLIAGLTLSHIFMPDITLAAAGAAGAITLSEAAAAAWIFITYKRRKKKLGLTFFIDKSGAKERIITLIKTAVPVTLIGVMLPLSNVADSFITVNILNSYTANATALFGLFSGVAMTVIGLPVAVCYGFATVAVPVVSGAKNSADKRKNSVRTLLLTLIFSLPCAVLCFIFAPNIVGILFRSLSSAEKEIAAKLIRLLSPTVVFLSFLQTENAVLIAKNRLYAPLAAMGAGITVRLVLSAILIKMPQFNVYGSAVALIACYLTADLVNLITIFLAKEKDCEKNGNQTADNRERNLTGNAARQYISGADGGIYGLRIPFALYKSGRGACFYRTCKCQRAVLRRKGFKRTALLR